MKNHPSIKRFVNHRSGFTIVEMIVAIGLFALLALLVTTSLFYMTGIQRSVTARQQLLNDFRLGIDVMGKEITSGSAFPSGCEDGCDNIFFVTKPRPDMPSRRVEYKLDPAGTGLIMKAEQKNYGLCASLPFHETCYQPITNQKVKLTSLTFFVNNKDYYKQPIITMAMNGNIMDNKREESVFELTTSITPRLLQNPSAVPPSDTEDPQVTIETPEYVLPEQNGNYTTGNMQVVFTGRAIDNVDVTELRWRNEQAGTSGIVPGDVNNWTTDPITLVPGTTNLIVITAYDADNNIGITRLTVNSTAFVPPADVPSLSISNGCGVSVWLDPNCPANSAWVEYYMCEGYCSPTLADYRGYQLACTSYEDGDRAPNSVFSYAAVAFNSAEQPSAMSNVVSITTGPDDPSCYPGGGGGGGPTTCEDPAATNFGGSLPCDYGGGGGGGGGQPANFRLSASPTFIYVKVSGTSTFAPQSTASTINVQGSGGDSVSFDAVSGLPNGAADIFIPPNAQFGGSTRFSVQVPDNTPIGQYRITVRGTQQSNGATKDIQLVLDVGAAGGGQQ